MIQILIVSGKFPIYSIFMCSELGASLMSSLAIAAIGLFAKATNKNFYGRRCHEQTFSKKFKLLFQKSITGYGPTFIPNRSACQSIV